MCIIIPDGITHPANTKTPREIVEFQLWQEHLCMPFDQFHRAVEQALGRSVWTHEFAWPENLRAEFNGQQGAFHARDC